MTSGPPAQLLDVVVAPDWSQAVALRVLDLSGPYRTTFDGTLPEATQVADPFPLTRLANPKLDDCRRRVQKRAHYRIRVLLHAGRPSWDPLPAVTPR